MTLDPLPPWLPPVGLALALSLAWAGLFRALRRPEVAALGAGLGLAAGWVMALDLVTASPRQLPERLPLLVLVLAAASLPLGVLAGGGRRWPGLAGAVLLLSLAAWWLVGAPATLPDLRRIALPLMAILVLLAALQLRLDGAVQAVACGALFLAALWIGRPPPGPWQVLALVALAAALGALPGGSAWPAAARLPMAAGLAALLAGPVLARGAATDWLAAAAPLSALWLGPALALHLGGRVGASFAWLLAGGLPLLFIWALVHGL